MATLRKYTVVAALSPYGAGGEMHEVDETVYAESQQGALAHLHRIAKDLTAVIVWCRVTEDFGAGTHKVAQVDPLGDLTEKLVTMPAKIGLQATSDLTPCTYKEEYK